MYILTVNSPITLCQNFTYLLTRLEKSRPRTLDSCRRGSSDIQMGPGHGVELGPKSKGNLLEESSVSL